MEEKNPVSGRRGGALMEVNIRPAGVTDAQGVVDVINSVIQEGGLTALYPTLTAEQEETFIQGLGPRSIMYVAELAGTILGVQTLEPLAPYTRAMDHVAVLGTYVYKNYRQQGVGSRLAERTMTFARQEGYEKAVVYVRAGNSAGQAFYRHIGFLPKAILERQVKIDGTYDDEVLMELFLDAGTPVGAAFEAPVEAPVETTPVAPTGVEREPAPPPPAPSPAPAVTRVVDPVVGAVTVRRAQRKDLRVLTAIMRGTMSWRAPVTEDEVIDMLYEKGYWLALSRRGGGLSGWRAENLVMCIDDFYVYPASFYAQVGGPLLETIEAEAGALSCEVAIAFLDEGIAPEAIGFFESQGYQRRGMDALYRIWREVAEEFLTGSRFMMIKQLRQDRIMRPL
jgi:L-amino acid N-acyltransferase YncA